MWQSIPVVPPSVLRTLKQEDYNFKLGLGNLARPVSKISKYVKRAGCCSVVQCEALGPVLNISERGRKGKARE